MQNIILTWWFRILRDAERSLVPSLTLQDIKQEVVRCHVIISQSFSEERLHSIAQHHRLPFITGSLFASRVILSLFLSCHLVSTAPRQLNHFNIQITATPTIMIFNNSSIATSFISLTLCLTWFSQLYICELI